jgi:hypothetical protein
MKKTPKGLHELQSLVDLQILTRTMKIPQNYFHLMMNAHAIINT